MEKYRVTLTADERHAWEKLVSVGRAAARKLPGKEVTPFLLSALAQATGGRTQAANLDLLENDAVVAAWIARAMVGT